MAIFPLSYIGIIVPVTLDVTGRNKSYYYIRNGGRSTYMSVLNKMSVFIEIGLQISLPLPVLWLKMCIKLSCTDWVA